MIFCTCNRRSEQFLKIDNEGDYTRSDLAVICNCCGCCCDLLLGYKRYGSSGLISPSAFIAEIEPETCTACGICHERCPVGAIDASGDKPVIKKEVCLGCGVCSRFCPTEACQLHVRAERPYIPEDSFEKIYMSSIHAGKLGNYVFPCQTSQVQAVLRKVVNRAVTLAPVKAVLLFQPVQDAALWVMRKSDQT
ncbi:MAG: hypothetical protein D3910_12570 [Candidatus Electrothrix sp. ATG2]|nr:hypothetical protein [Candidatus Electrothrix sp. ATG2]